MSEALALRALTVDDAEVMTDVLADPSLYTFTGGEPPTREGLRRLYAVQTRGRSCDGTERWVNAVVLLDGRPIGYVQATVPTDGSPAQVAWVVGRPWQGNGYAARAARMLLDVLAADGVTTVTALIHPDHVASRSVAARVGMRPTDVVVDGETLWSGPAARG